MKYCVLFPKAENVHLIKDVGMFAYKLHKLYGWECSVACLENGEYPYINKEVKGLKLEFIEKKYKNEIFNGLRYLKKHGKSIDILQIFHVTLSSVLYAYMYKKLNVSGKIFLKLDCTEELIAKIKALRGMKKNIFEFLFKNVSVIGVEQKRLYEEICELLPLYKEKILLIPNGIDYSVNYAFNSYDYDHKENICLTVARIGSTEKRIDLLLEAFKEFSKQSSEEWKLELIGLIENDFNKYLKDYFIKYPMLKDKVVLRGNIEDRELLFQEYNRAKIYICTSKYESFGISMLEAASCGNIILSTDVGIAKELQGTIFEMDTPKIIAEQIKVVAEDRNIKDKSYDIYNFCKQNYDIDVIVSRLYKEMCGGENG